MKTILILIAMSTSVLGFAQDANGDFQTSKYCHVNVNNPTTHFGSSYRQPVINATIKWSKVEGGGLADASVTLINRNTADGDVGYYLIAAGHSTDGVDFNANHFLYFNYQSPDEHTTSTFQTNWGWVNSQSNSDANPVVATGYEYLHETQVRLVTTFPHPHGDFALLEILTPIPPHFNFTYAGWNPSRFYNGVQIGSGNPVYDRYAGIHHPRGDIKKISTANNINWLENPIATGCYTITTIIDALFGWIWGNSVSTSVICNYVDNPYISLTWNPFGNGITESGSSGSGLFNTQNRHIGQLSFTISGPWCDFPVTDQYGKLHAMYPKQSVKNALNPSNTLAVDWFGIGSRKINCYDNLELPGAPGVSGQYFPANHYGDDNLVVLSSQTNITTTQPIHIYDGAEYTFRATGTIDLGPNFVVDPGATFIAEIGSCPTNSSKAVDPLNEVRDRLSQIHLPERLAYTAPDSVVFSRNRRSFSVSLSPNPNTGTFKLQSATQGRYQVRVLDVTGRIVHASSFEGSESTVTLSGVPTGTYLVELIGEHQTQQLKMVVQ